MKRSNSQTMNSRSSSPENRGVKRKWNPSTHKSQDTTMKNHDVCDACGDVGQFLCCDACPKSFHFTCVEPPMDLNDIENLKDKWYCTECQYMKDKSKVRRSNPRGLFQKLIDDVSIKNPKSYRLPDDIIHFFEGVSIDKQGKYIDITQTRRRGKHEQDYHQLKDKSGRYLQCYYCRKTALKKPLIMCDYCTLHWHFDCLNPPLAAPPNPLKKWRCPNHVDNVVKPPRVQKNPTVLKSKAPACAYQNYLNTIVDDHTENKLMFKNTTKLPLLGEESMITRKDGVVYRLPMKPFQIDFTTYAKKAIKAKKYVANERRNSIPSTLTSSSSSEVSTPPTSFISHLHKVDDKHLLQEFEPKKDHLLYLIKAATAPIKEKNTPHKYQKIEALLRQKTPQELLSLLK